MHRSGSTERGSSSSPREGDGWVVLERVEPPRRPGTDQRVTELDRSRHRHRRCRRRPRAAGGRSARRGGATVAGTDRNQETLDSIAGGLGIRPSAGTGAPSICSTRGLCAAGARRWSSASGGSTGWSTWSAAGAAGSRCTRRRSADWDLLHDLLVRTVQHTTRAFHDPAGGQRARAASSSSPPSRRRRRPTPTPPTPPPRPPPRPGPWPSPTASSPAAPPPTSSSSTRSSPRACGRRTRQGLPDLHPGRARRRGDRFSLLRCGRKDERSAALAYHGLMSPAKRPEDPRRQDDDRGVGAADRDDGPQHPRPPDPRPAAATRRPGPHRLLRRGARRPDRADPRNAGGGAEPGGDPPRAREHRGSSAEIVDFARAVRAPFEDETPEIFEPAELAESWRPRGRPEAGPPRAKSSASCASCPTARSRRSARACSGPGALWSSSASAPMR